MDQVSCCFSSHLHLILQVTLGCLFRRLGAAYIAIPQLAHFVFGLTIGVSFLNEMDKDGMPSILATKIIGSIVN